MAPGAEPGAKKVHQCSDCDHKPYANRQGLARHRKAMHSDEGKVRYRCPYCHYYGRLAGEVASQHRKMCHPDKSRVETQDLKTFKEADKSPFLTDPELSLSEEEDEDLLPPNLPQSGEEEVPCEAEAQEDMPVDETTTMVPLKGRAVVS